MWSLLLLTNVFLFFLIILRVLVSIHSQCWHALFLFLFVTHNVSFCNLSGLRPCASIFWSILKMVPSIFQGGLPWCLSFDEISAAELAFERFSCSSEELFSYFFFYLCLFDGSLPIFPSTCNFLSPNFGNSSDLAVISLFPLFIINMTLFSQPNSISISWLNILIIGIRVSGSFSFLLIILI